MGRHAALRSEEHTSELQSPQNLVCRLLLENRRGSEEHTSELQSPQNLVCRLLLEKITFKHSLRFNLKPRDKRLYITIIASTTKHYAPIAPTELSASRRPAKFAVYFFLKVREPPKISPFPINPLFQF